MVYQPIIDHRQGRVFGYEALSRPLIEGKWIPPEVWFRTATACGQAAEADLLALNAAAIHLRQLSREFVFVNWFVNVTPVNLCDRTFLDRLEQVLGYARSPTQWVLELVETMPYDPRTLTHNVRALRQLGWRIALDDVGAGDASLRALVHWEPDFVKVDRSLIRGIATSNLTRRLLAHLVSFMGSPDSVIAEGVEDEEDLMAVREAGVGLSQGYYWSPPLTAEQLEAWHAQTMDFHRR